MHLETELQPRWREGEREGENRRAGNGDLPEMWKR